MALKLIYQMFAKLLSWMALHARSDTANEIEIPSYAINWPSYSAHPLSGRLVRRVVSLFLVPCGTLRCACCTLGPAKW